MCTTDTARNGLTLTDKNSSCSCSADNRQTADTQTADSHARAAEVHETEAQSGPGAISADYLVSGMTCGHCVSSVTEELSALDGVESVTVDLNAGGNSRVIVSSAAPIDPGAVRAAVAEAGYKVVTAQP
ncbi:MAG: heavy-metal-associated domain-containing protein [Lacisediminihabitans sp.]